MSIYKHKETDNVWWKFEGWPGSSRFSFDRVTWYTYPMGYREITEEQRRSFDEDDPERGKYLRENWGLK